MEVVEDAVLMTNLAAWRDDGKDLAVGTKAVEEELNGADPIHLLMTAEIAEVVVTTSL